MKNLIHLSSYRIVLTLTVLMFVVLVIMICAFQADTDFPDLHLMVCRILKMTVDPRNSHHHLIQIGGTWVAWVMHQWQVLQEPVTETH